MVAERPRDVGGARLFHGRGPYRERFWLFRRGDGVQADTGDLSWYLHGLFG
jgi:protein ImuB